MSILNLVTNEELEEALKGIKEAIQQLRENGKEKANLPEYLTTSETAKLLKVSEFTVREWTKKGYLVRYMISSRYRYKTSEVLESLRRIESRR